MTDGQDIETAADDPGIEAMARATQSIHVAPLDGVRFVRAARARRHRNRTIISSVLAAAVIVAGVSVATAGSSSIQNNSVDAADQTDSPEAQPFPDPPAGSKWVGMNNLVVAVPADWPVLGSPCGDGSPGVVLDGTYSAVTDCVSHDSEVASVSLVPLNGSQPSEAGQPTCSRGGLATGCWANRAFVDEGVLVRVQFDSPGTVGDIERVLDTAMVLPDGWTTVPFGQWNNTPMARTAVLEAAGFKVDDSLIANVVAMPVKTDPDLGSPVREGATITLLPLEQEPKVRPLEDLTVTLAAPGATDETPARGDARWDAEERVVTYRFPNSRCGPDVSASLSDGVVALVVEGGAGPVDCPNELLKAAAIVSGLTEAPTELTVTEDGETKIVPVEPEQDAAPANEGLDSLVCPSGVMAGTPGGYLAQLPDGYDTQDEAVQAWLQGTKYEGQQFRVSEGGESAFVLRADGTAEAMLEFIVNSGYTVHSVYNCD